VVASDYHMADLWEHHRVVFALVHRMKNFLEDRREVFAVAHQQEVFELVANP
jgi:hypothetical protein